MGTQMCGAALLQWMQRERMRCPKCQFDHELQTTECLKCGIVFSRYRAAAEQAASLGVPEQHTLQPGHTQQADASIQNAAALSRSDSGFVFDRDDARREFKLRIFALPLALLLARLIAGTGLRMAAAMLAMVLHESGHAITAWLTGRWAVPLLWVTPHGEERSWVIVLALSGAIIFAGFLAWRAERWGWVAASGAALLLQLIALGLPGGALIVFWGDGGAMVLATILMATFYAPRESSLHKNLGLRAGLLAVGALSFLHVFLVWTGPWDEIPFGEIEGVNISDPSLLTERYGWPVTLLVDRYVRLGEACVIALATLYIWGLISGYLETRPRLAAE